MNGGEPVVGETITSFGEFGELDAAWHGPDGPRPLAAGLSEGRTRLVGDWPQTHLEWTFSFTAFPDLRLRRRVPLYDDLGRISEPEYADVHLMEDLDTRALPPGGAAHDGILDI